jgi:S-adenosylmethionine:tRNA ribosyltransferase-isomerase
VKTSEFDYDLPQELIAQTAVEPRDHSRLLVLSRKDGSIQHRRFYELPQFLRQGDVLVFNDSRVFPARLRGARSGGGSAKVELLLLEQRQKGVWKALVKPGKRLREGARFRVGRDGLEEVEGEVVGVEGDGARLVRLPEDLDLDRLGEVPLPPYITAPLADPERYQTVYARVAGSVAAPTAGLHFTPRLLDEVRAMGVETAFVTLHVGWGTFKPVELEDIQAHRMHAEHYELGAEAAEAINRAKREGRRVVVVGTTAVRLLESRAAMRSRPSRGCSTESAPDGILEPGAGWTDMFITPGYRFRVVDVLVTNFHLPRSTLLMLTCAFAGRDLVFRAYREAVAERYRFYSLGDATLVL